MPSDPSLIPSGPVDKYSHREDLLLWLGEQFRRFGDIYRASIHGADVYVVSDPIYVEHVLLKNWQNYPKGRAIKRIALLLGNGLMVSEGDLWIRQRRMIQPAFNRNSLNRLAGVIGAANARVLEKWEQAARMQVGVNVTRDVSAMTLEILLKLIFGEDYPDVASHFRVVADEQARDLEFALVFRSLGGVIVSATEKRRRLRRFPNDFLGLLMQARDRDSDERMSDAQLVKEIMTLIVAGHETTASVLNWLWYLLAHHPDAEIKLGQELDALTAAEPTNLGDLQKFLYTRRVLEEALRLYPPGWLMTRRAVRDDHLGDYFVPAGTEIYISPYYIQRHPSLWDMPDRFDPDRSAADASRDRHGLAMLPFSAGPRNCIGEHLARMEMQMHLMTIARRLRLRHAASAPPAMAAGVNLLSRHDFFMTPQLR